MSQSQTLHFSVEGQFITDLIRSRCLEGSSESAWRILESITDRVDIFQSIIKGEKTFQGVNELTLEDCSDKNLVEEILHNFRHSKKSPITKPRFSQIFSEEENDEEEVFDVEEYNERVDQEEAKRMAELNFFCEKMGLNLRQVEDVYLKTLQSENYEHPYGGWITDRGFFIPVDFQQHDQTFYSLFDKGYTFESEVADIERRWVRISNDENDKTSFMKDTIFRAMNIAVYDFNMTAKQKITLEKIIRARKILTKDGDSLKIHHYGEVCLENGQMKFIYHKDKDK